MNQFFNPIRAKLNKIKQTKSIKNILKISQQTQQAKTVPKNKKHYQNHKFLQKLPSSFDDLTSITRKYSLDTKISSKQAQSIKFYKQQLQRRKQRHYRQMYQLNQKYYQSKLILESQLQNLMITQKNIDEQIESIKNYKKLYCINFQELENLYDFIQQCQMERSIDSLLLSKYLGTSSAISNQSDSMLMDF